MTKAASSLFYLLYSHFSRNQITLINRLAGYAEHYAFTGYREGNLTYIHGGNTRTYVAQPMERVLFTVPGQGWYQCTYPGEI